ncbi:hypothetical protein [Planktotalea sp.]|uniref:hypothetical protein n=1 Tax=Planktotalea sp. TaxID=2029877 RepID=UPI0032995612
MKLFIVTLTAATVLASTASALVQPTFVENRAAAQNALSPFTGVEIGKVLAANDAATLGLGTIKLSDNQPKAVSPKATDLR